MKTFREFVEINDSVSDHEILSLYSSGQNINKIKEMTNASIGRIYRVLEKFGRKPNRRKNDEVHNTIKQYYNSGITAKKISELTGYSLRHVYHILKNNSH